jgi:hypothetical protein
MEQHITRMSEAREEAVGSGCDHGPSVALVNPLQLLMVPLDRSPVSFDCLAPLRPTETLPIAHQSLASIQLRPLPMIERFG